MPVTFATIFLNESRYLEANLRQHYDFCDRWILVEGADRQFPSSSVTDAGLSKDNSAEILRAFPDPDKKITFIQHGWANGKIDLRNRYAELIDGGRVIVFDADEFLSHHHLRWLLQDLLTLGRVAGCVRIPHVHFWKTTNQIITGGYYDVPHNRAYRWPFTPVRYLYNHNHPCIRTTGVSLHEHRLERYDRRLVGGAGPLRHDEPCWLHYGFIKDPQEIKDKNDYYVNRGETTSRPQTTENRAAWFADKLPAECQVYEWCGHYPEVFAHAQLEKT